MWGHQWCLRCIELHSHLWIPWILSSRLCCRCILLRSYRLSSQCIGLCSRYRSKELRWHAKSSSWIPSFWISRYRSSQHSCRNRWRSRIDGIYQSRLYCSSRLHWRLIITCLWSAIWSGQSYCHSCLQRSKVHLIRLYIAWTQTSWCWRSLSVISDRQLLQRSVPKQTPN